MSLINGCLDEIWADPAWQQPWVLVVVADASTTYEARVRDAKVPGHQKRALGTAVVTTRPMHKAVIGALSVGFRVATGFELTAHDDEAQALKTARELLARARA